MKYSFKNTLIDFDLPDNWQSEFDGKVYSFYNSSLQGLLQISTFLAEKEIFNINKELKKELIKHPTSQIIHVGPNKSIHFGLHLKENEMIRYDWIFGDKKLKLYCTLLLNENQEEDILNLNYQETIKILGTLKLN
jgi:hypothetical protein